MKVNNKTMRKQILDAVKISPSLADDDKKLIATIWWMEGWRDSDLYKKLCQVSSPETIRRTRARLVEEGLIKPSEKTQEARYQEFKKVRLSL